MDWTSIIVAVVTALGSFAGVYFANRKSQALVLYRLQQLETAVNRHNQVVERVYKLEERAEVTDERIRVANHRIDDLEQKKGA
jgi:hypothetical protein